MSSPFVLRDLKKKLGWFSAFSLVAWTPGRSTSSSYFWGGKYTRVGFKNILNWVGLFLSLDPVEIDNKNIPLGWQGNWRIINAFPSASWIVLANLAIFLLKIRLEGGWLSWPFFFLKFTKNNLHQLQHHQQHNLHRHHHHRHL